jgi:hypothetical protein
LVANGDVALPPTTVTLPFGVKPSPVTSMPFSSNSLCEILSVLSETFGSTSGASGSSVSSTTLKLSPS